jgi:Putative porin
MGLRMKNRWGYLLVMLLLPIAAAAPAMADELEEVRSLRDTTIALVNLLVQQGVLTREKADELIRQAEQAGKKSAGALPGAAATAPAGEVAQANAPAATGGAVAAAPPVEPGVVRVPYVPETVKKEIREEVKQEVLAQAKQERWGEPGALPQWLDRIAFAGDVRFRGQADRFPTDNVPNALPQQLQLPESGAYNINNTSEARNRMRLRVRFGAEAKVGETVTAGLRLTTGTSGTGGDPSTENENLGNYNARGTVGFDRAYVSYRPTSWAYVTGGRLGNPFLSNTTLVWGDDLSLQGLVAGLTPHFGEAFGAFATAGLFPIQDIEPTPLTSSRSKWLYGYQAGFKWQMTQAASLKFAAALYDYRHIEGIPNPTIFSTDFNLTAAAFRQKGNSVFDINSLLNTVAGTQNYLIGLASRFREANASASVDLAVFGTKHVILDADYVKNIGFNHNEILARTGLDLPGHTKGMQEKLTFGDASFSVKHSWQAYIGYRRVESDAVVDAFTDSDFHLGGTNTMGYYMGARYAFETNSTFGFRWYSAKQIDGLPLAIDVLQVDLIASF